MIRRMAALAAFLLWIGVCAFARADWEKTYGGSGEEALPFMISAGEGLLAVGHTSSTDGDLSIRTRSGQAGWMLRLDAKGNPQWSCCTAHVGRNKMSYPYAHGDDTFSAVLSAEGEGSEWLRVNARGKVDRRIPVPEPVLSCAHGNAVSCYGIPIDHAGKPTLALMVRHEDGTYCCAALDEAGNITFGTAVFSMGAGGALGVCREGDGSLAYVFPEDGDARVMWIEPGSEEEMRSVHVPVDSGKLQMVLCVLPCADGSVIFSGQLYAIGSVVLRVSAQGETLFVVDDCENLEQMTLTPFGFAGVDDDEILFYDEDGELLGTRTHAGGHRMSAVAPLGDGVAVMEQLFEATRKTVQVTAYETYAPAVHRDETGVLYAREYSTLVDAWVERDALALNLVDVQGENVCVRVDTQGTVLSQTETRQEKQAGFELAHGRIVCTEMEGGALVRLYATQGILWQTVTPIHTAADRMQWLCAAQLPDGDILLGGRYLTEIIANSEEKRFRREMTRDGLMQEAVVARLSADGVLQGVETIAGFGAVGAIAPEAVQGRIMLLCAKGNMTDSDLSNIVSLDEGLSVALDTRLDADEARLLPFGQSLVAIGTRTRNGRRTVVVLDVVPMEKTM